MKIQFLGAAREVTGSKHVLTTLGGKKILLDCGMYQGKGQETDTMNRDLGFDPREIDYLLLSHAHIDHSGLIPFICKGGFKGTVFCTHATRDLCSIMLADCGKIQESDTKTFNKKRLRMGLPPVEPIYNKEDALKAMELFVSIPYNKPFFVDEGVKVMFTETGHLLGGGVINIEITENGKKTRLAYTGDIGRPVNRILRPPQPFPQADYIICEATYGDRLHKQIHEAEEDLLDAVRFTCVEKKGKLIIPSFSIGRTQEIVYALNNLFNTRKLPKVKIFVDSPLSFNATNIIRLHTECFNENILHVMETDPDPFGFNGLIYVQDAEESKSINSLDEPCVIISASGMMEAGRVKHHLANNIDNPANTVLVAGYCAPATLGAKIARGDKEVSIFGVLHKLNADVRIIESLSGHGDYKEMLDFLDCQDKDKVKQIMLVHGEFDVQVAYKKHLQDRGFNYVKIPELREEIEINHK